MLQRVFSRGVACALGVLLAFLGGVWYWLRDEPATLNQRATELPDDLFDGTTRVWARTKHPWKWLRLTAEGYQILEHAGPWRPAKVVANGSWSIVSPEKRLIALGNPLLSFARGTNFSDPIGVRLSSTSDTVEFVSLRAVHGAETCPEEFEKLSESWCAAREAALSPDEQMAAVFRRAVDSKRR